MLARSKGINVEGRQIEECATRLFGDGRWALGCHVLRVCCSAITGCAVQDILCRLARCLYPPTSKQSVQLPHSDIVTQKGTYQTRIEKNEDVRSSGVHRRRSVTVSPLSCPPNAIDNARPESAPLLQGGHEPASTDRGFFSALTHPTRTLTNLEKVLAAAGIALLVLTGTFIGLFTGAEVALGKERAKEGKTEWKTTTHTVSATTTATRTETAPGSTVTAVPTGKPESVSGSLHRMMCCLVFSFIVPAAC